VLKEHLNPIAFQLVMSELEKVSKMPKGFRWDETVKAIGVSLYKLAPRAYNLFARTWCMPSKTTILRQLRRVPFKVGLNDCIADAMKAKSLKIRPHQRFCAISFDEMSISPHLELNLSLGRIEGYDDLGGNVRRTSSIADHGLLFMAQGVTEGWKMPLAYYFCASNLDGLTLKDLTLGVIDFLTYSGFTVVAAICDQVATYRKAFSKLTGASVMSHKEFFIHKDRTIFTIYDPPHLLKNTRNALLNGYDIEFEPNKFARWKHIKTFFQFDQGNFRMAQNMSAKHIDPKGKTKMRVKLAAQVLSHHVYAGMTACRRMKVMDGDAEDTANFVRQIDQLFDLFNGVSKTPSHGKDFLTALHSEFKI